MKISKQIWVGVTMLVATGFAAGPAGSQDDARL